MEQRYRLNASLIIQIKESRFTEYPMGISTSSSTLFCLQVI